MMKSDLEGLFNILKNFYKTIDIEKLIKTALKEFTFSRNELKRLEKEYLEKPDKDIFKLCEMY